MDFIGHVLQPSESQRYTAELALEHPFIKEENTVPGPVEEQAAEKAAEISDAEWTEAESDATTSIGVSEGEVAQLAGSDTLCKSHYGDM